MMDCLHRLLWFVWEHFHTLVNSWLLIISHGEFYATVAFILNHPTKKKLQVQKCPWSGSTLAFHHRQAFPAPPGQTQLSHYWSRPQWCVLSFWSSPLSEFSLIYVSVAKVHFTFDLLPSVRPGAALSSDCPLLEQTSMVSSSGLTGVKSAIHSFNEYLRACYPLNTALIPAGWLHKTILHIPWIQNLKFKTSEFRDPSTRGRRRASFCPREPGSALLSA